MRLKVFHEGEWKSYPAKSYEEYTYEWLGEPHASASVRYDPNGNETARNLASNPSFERSAEDGWLKGSRVGVGSITSTSRRVHHGERSRVLRWDDNAAEIQTVVYVPVDVEPGDWVAISAWLTTDSGNTLFVRPVISEYTNGNSTYISHNYKPERQRLLQEEMAPVSFAYQVTAEDVEIARTGLVFSNGLSEYQSPTGYAYLDAVNIAVADSESTALAQVETYFDGDTVPDRAWVDFQPRNISGVKRIWPRSVTPPSPGTHYAWLGEPHASTSVKKVDGEIVARNLAIYPSFETGGTSHLRSGSLVNFGGLTSSNPARVSHGRRARVVSWEPDDNAREIRMIIQQQLPAQPGDWVAISTHTTAYGNLYVAGIITEADENNIYIRHNYLGEYVSVGQDNMTKLTYAVQMGEGVGTVRAGLRFSGSAGDYSPIPASAYGYLDGWHIAIADTEAEALNQVETYFDGDTESDRAHDLWYNTDGVPHEWVNGQGWTPAR